MASQEFASWGRRAAILALLALLPALGWPLPSRALADPNLRAVEAKARIAARAVKLSVDNIVALGGDPLFDALLDFTKTAAAVGIQPSDLIPVCPDKCSQPSRAYAHVASSNCGGTAIVATDEFTEAGIEQIAQVYLFADDGSFVVRGGKFTHAELQQLILDLLREHSSGC